MITSQVRQSFIETAFPDDSRLCGVDDSNQPPGHHSNSDENPHKNYQQFVRQAELGMSTLTVQGAKEGARTSDWLYLKKGQ